MKPAQPKISVVLSFYNEAGVIPELLSRLRAAFASLGSEISGHELIFVNDNSKDDSEAILRAELPKGDVVLVNMSRNFGVSECVIAGMREATGDAIVYMDADLQDPPEVIPEMVRKWKEDADAEVVYTTRTKRDGEHWLKMLWTRFGYRALKKIYDIQLPVDSGDFKLLSRKVVDQLLALKESKPFIRGLVTWIGYKQVPVYYEREGRFDGRENTKFPVLSKRVIYNYLDSALISFSDAPLKLSLFGGMALSFVSFLYILVVIFQKIMGWAEPGWPAIMCAVLMIGGMQMMMLGFIGLYVGAIFRETKGRPLYIVKEVLRQGTPS